MENPAHLERMGRELKCPICLSLLNSAVSLNCNHFFCNSCIMKSMKSSSDCPVCKIPYQRREVRPAPHMDNLVSIYKSMEVASGVNIFVTQNAPSTKSSDGKQQGDDDCSHDEQDPLKLCQDRAKKQKKCRGKGSRKTKFILKKSSPVSVKPSFPTKKRVQVPQCPLSETPTQPAKLVGKLMDEKSKQSSATPKEQPALNENGELVLSPFFWLRDREVENLSQHCSGNQLTDIPSPDVPTFSDIKDSDDENCSRLNPLDEVHGKASDVADLFDSEMFEWTQRACSPELCSSPSKMQVADNNEIDIIQVKEQKEAQQNNKLDEEPSAEETRSRNSRKNGGNMYLLPDCPPAGTKDATDQVVSNETNKRGRRARNITKRKCATSHTSPVFYINDSSLDKTCKRSKKACQSVAATKPTSENVDALSIRAESQNHGDEKGIGTNDNSLAKTGKRSRKAHQSVFATKPTSKNVVSHSVRAESQNHGDEKVITELSSSLGNDEGTDEDFTQKKAGKICKEINAKNMMHCPVRSRKQKLVSMPNKMLVEVSKIQKQTNKDTTAELSRINIPTDDSKKASESRTKFKKLAREAKSCDRELKSNKKAKVSSDDNSKNDTVEIGEGHGKVNDSGNQSAENIKGNCNVRVLTGQSPVQKLPSLTNGVVLQRCEAIPSKIQCAFCLSSEESEASGEIIHYYNGKPVAADHNGGSKVIHSHKNCTEWAPNVYFEDDTAINLEAELTRSRRIKCCCCGIKGAALGCYERSCRKSFHVTCAKLIPQCRWDTDNFVMLCPLHVSSELPNESSEAQARRKKSNPRKQSNVEHNKVAVKQDSNTRQDWNFCGSSKKLVLCCSSLKNAERESVSEFERLSGITVLKNWDSSVTHVIASIDENGACRRTLKVLMGILEGKWILSMDWINACMEATQLVNEEPYEINVDIYGIRDGPRLGRLRLQNKQRKLFDGFKFYFMGEFIPSYKGYLQDLVTAAGGTILHRKPVPEGQKALSTSSSKCQTFVIYSLELPDQCHPCKKGTFNRRQSDAKALACSAGAKVASNSWVLNSIAACKLQSLSE